jgi:tetratricopeptide (TPR) repeat protein
VRATLDWSVTLLDAEQQALLRRLSVFSGGWTLPACEAIGESASTEALLQLVDHSLVQVDRRTPGRTRYRLLETVRQYAAERLMRAGETHATRALHLRYYVDVAEQVERGLDGSGQVDSLAIFDLEAANLRAALDFALEQADAESALRLLGALGDYWHLRGQSLAGLNLARAALELAPKSTPRTRARALRAAGRMAVCVRATTAQAWLEQSLTVCREHDDSGGAARAMLELGRMWIDAAVLDRAVAILEHGCQLAEAAGDVHASGALLVALGQAHLDRADYATSLPLLERGRALLRELGDRLGEANALQHIAMARLELCDIAEAESALDAAHALLSELGDASGVAWIEHDLGRVALDNHELDRAATCFERSLRQFRLLGHGNGIAWTLHNLGRTHMLGGDLDLAEGCLVEGLEQFVRLDHARGEGWAHANLAWLQARRGRTDAAWARLAQALSKFRSQKYGVGLSLCAVVAAQLVLGDCPRQAARWLGLSEQLGYGGLYDRERASQVAGALRERLDEKDFAREWMGGGSLTGAALRAELKRLSARAAREPSLATG